MNQGGNYWTLFTPGIWKVLHAVFHLGLWNLTEMKERCRVLDRVRHSAELRAEDFAAFVYVPYCQYQVPYDAAETYLSAQQGRAAAFLVRVDLSDIRHVVFAFLTSADRATFLDTPGLIKPRTQPRAEIEMQALVPHCGLTLLRTNVGHGSDTVTKGPTLPR